MCCDPLYPIRSRTGPERGNSLLKRRLQIGRVVWAAESADELDEDVALQVYADGVGLVMISARDLRCEKTRATTVGEVGSLQK